ncbi:MAG: histidine kinase [Oceanospirillaceae bacterium]|uniref:HDOD domain-containing protein n=2 Tax=unclassified Thalassolituus TaxID=2624967 RepID=UPI000C531B34|nr:HDOD domain-containing protein [Thalassolituus sp. UBA6592]MAS25402.1 histidine kinase [Oceanospirillaceae bacterium]MAX99511.1 histidine kinase [Oceanospirillaceae bacterium]MBL35069.1 histidine kinase [Oceanospirillaceae bacterium]MBS54878.1 histidine kinase [Oceanospirillaceae bacterium]|tara:strand:- start:675 stop:1553 length:879 start_codon:yes stop_codon:yes gene_type:complete
MARELTEEQIHTILQGIKIPPQPQILVDLQMEQVMPDPDISRIAKLISQDVGLAGTILKVVNSPFYGLKNRISSVQQAVTLIGLNSVINIINGLSIKSEMTDDVIVDMNRFWDTANDIAQVATQVAKQVGYPNPDIAYLLGLFHNCGIPLLMQRFDNYQQVIEESYAHPELRVVDVENQHLNTNHAVIGYYTAKAWNLPKILCDVIAEHHSATHYFTSSHQKDSEGKTLLAILKLAEHICGNYQILGRQKEDLEWQSIDQEVLTYLGLGEYDLEQMEANFAEMGIGAQNYRY